MPPLLNILIKRLILSRLPKSILFSFTNDYFWAISSSWDDFPASSDDMLPRAECVLILLLSPRGVQQHSSRCHPGKHCEQLPEVVRIDSALGTKPRSQKLNGSLFLTHTMLSSPECPSTWLLRDTAEFLSTNRHLHSYNREKKEPRKPRQALECL